MWKNFWRNFGVHNAVRHSSTFNFSEINFLKNFTQIKYTKIVYSLFMNFLKFQFDSLVTKKVLRFKKINTINREIEVGNVGIGKNRISDTCP